MGDHQSPAHDGAMTVEPVHYTIRVDGHLGAAMLSAFPHLAAELVVQTVLTGVLDRSALHGVLAQLEMLGLDLVEVHQVSWAAPSHEHPGEQPC
jgi:hypothetical protein